MSPCEIDGTDVDRDRQLAEGAMLLSSVSVVGNSLRLARQVG
jgi:hypothetical protein